jgi:hypothetical protein
MVVHLVLMLILSLMSVGPPREPTINIVQALPIEAEEEPFELNEDFTFSELPATEIGANSFDVSDSANSLAVIVTEVSQVPTPEYIDSNVPDVLIDNTIAIATALNHSDNKTVRGAVGEGVTGATGAIDRLTHEILRKMEERKTLVVWLFDKSPSMLRQRQEVIGRFDRIYEELGVIEASNNPAFAKHDDKPLLTSIVEFGDTVELLTEDPTDNVDEIKEIVKGIEPDMTGNEKVFSALFQAATAYKDLRIPESVTREPERNVMLVVFTDERGDDFVGVDKTVEVCRRYGMPVYVVGVPAPFGREETLVKWVDPDPSYDQTPQWGEVNQGPETFAPERIKLSFGDEKEESTPIDSGFGPFALTRICYETGGIYFAVHPNRNVNRAVSRREIDDYSAHLEHFFDPTVMLRYRPEYVTQEEYLRRVHGNKARLALHTAAQMTWMAPMEDPRLRFPKTDEASFVEALNEAQKVPAKLEPLLLRLYETMKAGEADRTKEATPRWQAGYDLAIGRVMAVVVRTQSYNMMLAAAKRGLRFENEKNNTWVLEPSDNLDEVGSQMEKLAEKAKEYLNRVITEHPDTPWALLAQKELERPLGYNWNEDYTEPRREGMGGGGNNTPARNDAARRLERTMPTRKPPKL